VRLPSHSVTHSGGVAVGTRSGGSAAKNSSPSKCLHGNFRLGHEHFATRSSSATRTWYTALPLHSPQMAVSLRPSASHRRGGADFFPAASALASGASAAICSAERSTDTIVVRVADWVGDGNRRGPE